MITKEEMRERMIQGKPYVGEHLPDESEAKERLYEFNHAPLKEAGKRIEILKPVLGSVGENSYIEQPFYFDHGYNIHIGNNFYSNTDLIILDQCPVTIGDHVFIGPRVGIFCATHPIDAMIRNLQLEGGKPITIGNDVWIGGQVTINPGVTIGNDVIIGSGSVVTKDIPDHVIAAGNPCKVIRTITKEDHEIWMQELKQFEKETQITLDHD